MRKLIFPLIIAGLFIAALFALIGQARVRASALPGETVVQSETQDGNLREIVAPADAEAAQAPNIGFIDSPSATCYQPDSTTDACYVNWYYLSVSASPNYMITMTVQLNAIGYLSNVQGFFQTSMYVPYNMHDRGFKVPCGALGSGGNPRLGAAYA